MNSTNARKFRLPAPLLNMESTDSIKFESENVVAEGWQGMQSSAATETSQGPQKVEPNYGHCVTEEDKPESLQLHVQHKYTDHLSDLKPSGEACLTQLNRFPNRLHAMLSCPETAKTGIVGWQPHGRCFLVFRPKEFVERILPR